MRETLRSQIERMLADLIERQRVLNKHIKEYVEAGDLGSAAVNQIKHETLEVVRLRLIDCLT